MEGIDTATMPETAGDFYLRRRYRMLPLSPLRAASLKLAAYAQ